VNNLGELPDDLPVPVDDGAADHLSGLSLPELTLNATDGTQVQLRELQGWFVIYVYPMTGRPDTPLPDNWDSIPGARGCTPQSCGFRDHHAELVALSAGVYGLSSQSTAYQAEAKQRLHLPFELLSDEGLLLKQHLKLPTFVTDEMELYRRITLIVKDGNIQQVFYPVFPPSENAADVVAWLRAIA